MLITTTPTVSGFEIVEYKDLVFGEVIQGINVVKDFAAGITNFIGGRSVSYEGELEKARKGALNEMQRRASDIGANAIVGVDIDYEVLGTNNNMILVTASGTAVVIR
ncbi:MAG: heavy metal-binding domain-containing protein [Coriobacteriia bacterium]|nr:heavy metal-binding domain-containing protein [Coriobacteriia bacterium]